MGKRQAVCGARRQAVVLIALLLFMERIVAFVGAGRMHVICVSQF